MAVFLLFSCSYIAIAGESEQYIVVSIDGKEKKLCVKGDIFYSVNALDKCLRIVEIEKDTLVLEDVKSKNGFILKSGDRIPLEGAEIIFEKTVSSDTIEYKNKPPGKLTKGQVEDLAVKNLNRDGNVKNLMKNHETTKPRKHGRTEARKN